MSSLVLDASISLAWLLDDEVSAPADAARARLATDSVFVPRIWHLEIRNALLVAERRGRLSRQMADERLDALSVLPIHTDNEPSLHRTMALARYHGTSFYDALYLELALRMQAELATLDTSLRKSRIEAGNTGRIPSMNRRAG